MEKGEEVRGRVKRCGKGKRNGEGYEWKGMCKEVGKG